MPRYLYLAIAWLAVGIGTVGIFLPVLPTTPLLLVALWAGSKGSPRFKWWLLRHSLFGPVLMQWYRHGAIDTKAKVLAVVVMASSWGYLFFRGSNLIVLVFLAVLFTGLSIFLATRPKPLR